MTNPFKTIVLGTADDIKKEEKCAIPFPVPKLIKKEDSLLDENNFLQEMREFMNEFAEDELGLNSIDEPSEMTKEQANWYVKLYNETLKKEEEINSMCDKEIERITKSVNLFREKQLKGTESQKKYFESLLKAFAMSELEGKKTKSLKLPYGTIAFKKQQPVFTYNDEEEIMMMLKATNPELVKVKTTESIDKTKLKKAGSIVGTKLYIADKELDIDVEMREDKFEVKIAK